MNNDGLRYPPQKSRRILVHAQRFQNQMSTIIRNNRDRIKSFSTLEKFNGLILSDPMCKHIRTEKLSSKQLHITLSYESGCTCNRMIQFLKNKENLIIMIYFNQILLYIHYAQMMLQILVQFLLLNNAVN